MQSESNGQAQTDEDADLKLLFRSHAPSFARVDMDALLSESAQRSSLATSSVGPSDPGNREVPGHTASQVSGVSQSRRRIIMMKSIRSWPVQLASIATVVLVAFLIGTVIHQTTSVGFAQLQKALQNTQSYSFRRDFGNGLIERVMVLDEFRSRRERKGGLGNENSVIVFDWKQQRALVLDQTNKTARVQAIYPTAEVMADLRDAVTQFSRVPERASRKIAEKKLDGNSVIEFAITDKYGEQVVVVDAGTSLPMRTEWVGMKGAPPDAKVVDSEYSFKPDLDVALFSIMPPEGFAEIPSVEPRGNRPKDAELQNLVVSADKGIGDVRFGMSKERIVKLLGEPDGIEVAFVLDNHDPVIDGELGQQLVIEDKKLPAEKLLYNSRGFQLIVSKQFGLEAVDCFGPPLSGMFIRAFPGKTNDGLRMGAKRVDVIKALGGEPNVQMPVARFGEEMLTYSSPDGSMIAFRLRDDFVCGITVGKRVAKGADAPEKEPAGKGPEVENDNASVKPQSPMPTTPFAAIVAAFESEANVLKEELRAIPNAEQRQFESSKLLHLPEKYAEQFLALSSRHPASTEALGCHRWVIVNVVDLSHSTVKEALTRVASHHAKSNDLEEIIMRARFGGGHFKSLLEAILSQNRDRRMRGLACFAIGQNLMNQAVNFVFSPAKRNEARFVISSPDERKQLAGEAERYFERVVDEFADVVWTERNLGDLAKAFLQSLRSPVAIGKSAPEIDALSAEGDRLKLSDFRGRVVVLQFSANWCSPCKAMYPRLRELVQKFSNDEVVVLGVMADSRVDTILQARKKGEILWPTWHDGMDGPIAAAWGIRGFPSVFLINSDGVIVSQSNDLEMALISSLAQGSSATSENRTGGKK